MQTIISGLTQAANLATQAGQAARSFAVEASPGLGTLVIRWLYMLFS